MAIKMTMKSMPEGERPREKMIKTGASALSNAELIATVIGSGSSQESALTLAHRVLSLDPKGLSHLAGANIEELSSIRGIGVSKACQIMAVAELGRRICSEQTSVKVKVAGPAEIAEIMIVEMRHLVKEVFKVVLLDTKNQIISIEDISVGSLNASIVHPREVFQPAIRRSANAVVLIHNHPSGHPEPSTEDKRVTERLVEAGQLMGIQVLDHIVIGDLKYYSFKEHDMM
ncbi:RadC family protein [Acidaminobacter hydrogenoformans]|uniref:DNA replication and repair protein RadC n=1 Tax=Acidaminobacter hydrogenoformans DSM 2784 TaxID=1120920 RepID=A0A1G5RSZ4_9FIRM|nr:DNA repair protein RadC [Acidaminobacter hydrogenoformans]SCZ77213.1 DNA replication and repair protein RadC [Acidaminobacter hydrogenoformans DSM 2784]